MYSYPRVLTKFFIVFSFPLAYCFPFYFPRKVEAQNHSSSGMDTNPVTADRNCYVAIATKQVFFIIYSKFVITAKHMHVIVIRICYSADVCIQVTNACGQNIYNLKINYKAIVIIN